MNSITPLILTYDEAPNIARVLDQLTWAKRVVIVDSYSDDATEAIAKRYPNVVFVQRKFDSHGNQWNFGLRETGVDSDWVLGLDADYVLSDELVSELQSLEPPSDIAAYFVTFRYCIAGRPLRATAYTPVAVLYRRAGAHYIQDGHTHRIVFSGKHSFLKGRIDHDDRKPLFRWVASQNRYMQLEAEKLLSAEWSTLNWVGRIRRMRIVAPFAMLVYCLLLRGLILDGRAGIFYSFQRTFAEFLLSLYLIEHDLMRLCGGRK